MQRYWKRLLLALFMSSSCFLGTVIWYRSGQQVHRNHGDKKPIARLSESINEVQRKPLARVIWETITQNEELYAGEAIRTSTASEAKILFLKTGAIIELEPDSLIVLEESEDGLALNFLQGNMFVKSGGSGGVQGLKLKSGESEIALNNADLSLSKSEQGAVDLEVFGGSAQLTQGNKQLMLGKNQAGTLGEDGLDVAKNRIRILHPLPGEPVYIDPNARQPVSFKWDQLPEGYTVALEVGPDRSKLTPLGESTPASSGEILSPLKVGKSFWRLVAKHSDPNQPEMKSQIFPVDVLAKSPPLVLEPEKDSVVAVNQLEPKTKFRWVSRSHYDNLVVEVAKDPALKQKILQQPLDPKLSFAELEIKQSGVYYFRLTGFMKIKDKLEPVSSPIQKFQLQVGVDVVPPKLKSPMPRQTITYNQILNSGLNLSWESVLGIEKYHVHIEKEAKDATTVPVMDKVVVTNPLRLTALEPGIYKWWVQSIGPEGKTSENSEIRFFKVDEMPRVDWVQGPEPEEFLYYTANPSFMVQWEKGSSETTAWQVRYAPEGELTPETPWKKQDTPVLKTYVDKPGAYHIEVEALNKEGKAVARSTVKTVVVQEKPLLPAPQFAQELPEVLKSDRRGNLSLKWTPVEGAQKYKIEVLNPENGEVIEERVSERNVASLTRLKPGQYKVKVKAVDRHNRDGNLSEDKALEVPKTSDIQAPVIKKLKVK